MILNPAHPGDVLRDYLGTMTVGEAASRLGIARPHLSRILNGHAGITAPMSLRLAAARGTSPDFWLRLQMQRDLWVAQKERQPKVRPFPHVASRRTDAARAWTLSHLERCGARSPFLLWAQFLPRQYFRSRQHFGFAQGSGIDHNGVVRRHQRRRGAGAVALVALA